jgi:hypothetical protein
MVESTEKMGYDLEGWFPASQISEKLKSLLVEKYQRPEHQQIGELVKCSFEKYQNRLITLV